MAAAASFDAHRFSVGQQAMLKHFCPKDAIARAGADVSTVSLIIYEKFRLENGGVGPFLNDPKDRYNCQAFAVTITKIGTFEPALLVNGRILYVECLITKRGEVEAKVKEGFVHSGKMINSIAIAYFKDQGKTYYLTLNGNKAAGGAMEETDTKEDHYKFGLSEALAKAALREFAEEMLALDKKQAKQMSDSQIFWYIQKATQCESIISRVLINEEFERLPQKEFNDLMLSASTMINLGICSLGTIRNALVKEEGKRDIPQIIDEQTAMNPKKFRQATQVMFHKDWPQMGVCHIYFRGSPY